jgi:hypothetical protein
MRIGVPALVVAVMAWGCGGSSEPRGDLPDGGIPGDVPVLVDTNVPDVPPTDRGTTDPFADAVDGGDDEGEETDPGGPIDPFCTRATACGNGATCNLCSGRCEDRSPGWGAIEITSAYPLQGAPGDFIVVDGAGYGLFSSATIGGVGVPSQKDENRLIITRKDGATGALSVGSAGFAEAMETSSQYAGPQACGPGDPPATGVVPVDPWEIGPWAVGFADYNKNSATVRAFYPATCGGLRRPPAGGQFPFVMFMHGDGYVPLNFEYLARHLASWGFLTAIPENGDDSVLNKGRISPQDWFAALAGMGTGGDAAIVCHSKGAEYTHELGFSDVRAVVFLGPVYTPAIEDPYGSSLFPIPGLVLGGSEDGQPTADKCYEVYHQLPTPRYMAMIKRGNHGQFVDDKMWDPPSDGSGAFIARNRQHELTQAFTLAFLQRAFGQTESFSGWLSAPGLSDELVFSSDL